MRPLDATMKEQPLVTFYVPTQKYNDKIAAVDAVFEATTAGCAKPEAETIPGRSDAIRTVKTDVAEYASATKSDPLTVRMAFEQ